LRIDCIITSKRDKRNLSAFKILDKKIKNLFLACKFRWFFLLYKENNKLPINMLQKYKKKFFETEINKNRI